jgi:hypothetical protein
MLEPPTPTEVALELHQKGESYNQGDMSLGLIWAMIQVTRAQRGFSKQGLS